MILKINDIKIGQRVRDQYGDMESLANSIKEHGLLHPIVVDADYNLIAGGRRLLACERIGMKEIEAKVLKDISERELRVLELEENIRRKDLTELEKSKNLVELAEIREQELKEKVEKDTFHGVRENLRGRDVEVPAESAKTNLGGRPSLSGIPIRELSEELSIPPQTLRDARQHVAAVEEFPPLADLPKYKAIETARELRQAPLEEQEKILDFAQRRMQTASIQKSNDFNSYIDACGKVADKYIDFMYSLARLDVSDEKLKMWSELINSNRDSLADYEQFTREAIPKLVKLQKFLKGALDGK